MEDMSYEDGVRDGKIAAIEDMVSKHDKKLDHHDKILAGILAVVGFIQFIPVLKSVFGE